ncbi:MAG: exodeoxyribonuclease III [Actinomycetaceae bacterium]|nr:exodeoxyribonuclease III [Actinomycetaceae bacterium]
MKIATINVNGIRAAFRKGMDSWLEKEQPDLLLLQETRAPAEIISDLFGEKWQVKATPSRLKGRAGVAVIARQGIELGPSSNHNFEDGPDVDSGRWIEVDAQVGGATVTFVSGYLHSGELGSPKQDAKMAYLRAVTERLAQLADGRKVLIAGDFNVVRSELDIKNWKPNHNKRAGVLDEEIAFLDQWMEGEWVDLTRHHLTEGERAPYTWWSWRGRAFDNDAGWRIDYHMVTPQLLPALAPTWVDRAPTNDARFSDHAPLLTEIDEDKLAEN